MGGGRPTGNIEKTMGIFDRMGKVIQSNLNALLERAEDDKKLIELNLEEMDEQIKAGYQEVVQAVAAEKQLRKKSDDLRADVERWDKRAELALKSGDEALARRYRAVLESWQCIELDVSIAEGAARLRASLRLRLPDAVQAASALAINAAALVTHDRDFSRVRSLRVIC